MIIGAIIVGVFIVALMFLATYIDENIEMIKDSVILVFIENEADKNELYKEIEKLFKW